MRLIRDDADENVKATLQKIAPEPPRSSLSVTVRAVQRHADLLADCLEDIEIIGRQLDDKLSFEQIEALQRAIEHQLAYVVLSYKSSVERI